MDAETTCVVCGRPEGYERAGQCSARWYGHESGPCYRLGYEREKARVEKAERERDRLRADLARARDAALMLADAAERIVCVEGAPACAEECKRAVFNYDEQPECICGNAELRAYMDVARDAIRALKGGGGG